MVLAKLIPLYFAAALGSYYLNVPQSHRIAAIATLIAPPLTVLTALLPLIKPWESFTVQ